MADSKSPKKEGEEKEVKSTYETRRDELAKLDKELETKIRETRNETGLESSDMIRLGSIRFLEQCNEALKKCQELVDEAKAEASVIKEQQKGLEKAKEYIDQRSIEVRDLETKVKNRAATIERVAEELGKDIGGKL